MEPHHQQEPQQQQHQQGHEGLGDSSSTGSSSKSSFLCRQSSTRWTPTSDQIRILKDLYYNNGVRSPSAEQIQKISARLRQYGKIEGKNVFYWFQNHKARERQKKRFTVDMAAMQRGGGTSTVNSWKSEDSMIHTKYTTNNIITPGVSSSSSSCPSSPGVLGVGQMGSMGYGPVLMEKSFRDCSISSGTGSSNLCWIGNTSIDPYSSSDHYFYKTKPIQTIREEEEEEEEEEVQEEEAPEIETLPLFPMHGEDNIAGLCTSNRPHMQQPSWYAPEADKSGSRTSLELSLNSYSGRSSGTD